MAQEGSQKIGKKIGIASLIIMTSVFLSRILGQVRQSYIAYIAGAGSDVDAYTIAFQIPDILNHIIAGGYLSVTFVPIFSDYLEQKCEDKGWEIFSIVITTFGTILIGLTLIAMWATPFLVATVAPGFADQPATLAKAIKMTRIILPAQTCFFLGGIFMAVQYAKGHFFIPALSPIIYNLGIISGGIFLGSQLGIEGFSWGVLAGAFLGQFVLQGYGCLRLGMRFRPNWNFKHRDFHKFILLTIPLILGLSMTFSMEFFFKFFGSMLGQGTVSALNYALRVELLLVALFGQAAGVASFPYLSRLYAQGNIALLCQTLNDTLKRYIGFVIPASALMIVCSREIVVVLFQRGEFGEQATDLTSMALKIFLLGAFAMAFVNIVVRGFYAMKNTWLPALFGTLAVVLSVPLYYILQSYLNAIGIAIGVTISAVLQMLILYTVWHRLTKDDGVINTYIAIAKAMLFALLLWGILWITRYQLVNYFDKNSFMGALSICCTLGIVFVVVVLPLAGFFGLDDINKILLKPMTRLRKVK